MRPEQATFKTLDVDTRAGGHLFAGVDPRQALERRNDAPAEARDKEIARAEEKRQRLMAETRPSQVEKGVEILGLILENLNPHQSESDGRRLGVLLEARGRTGRAQDRRVGPGL